MHSGVRALASTECGSGSIPAQCLMCIIMIEFVVGCRPVPMVFLLVLWFSSLYKNQHLEIPICILKSKTVQLSRFALLFICNICSFSQLRASI